MVAGDDDGGSVEIGRKKEISLCAVLSTRAVKRSFSPFPAANEFTLCCVVPIPIARSENPDPITNSATPKYPNGSLR